MRAEGRTVALTARASAGRAVSGQGGIREVQAEKEGHFFEEVGVGGGK